MPILDRLQDPADLRGLSDAELDQLAAEIRETIIRTVAGRAATSARRSAWSRSRWPCTACSSRRATGSSGTPATRRTPTSCSPAASTGSTRCARSTASAASRAARESAHDVMDGGHAGTGLSIAAGPRHRPRHAPLDGADRGRGRRRRAAVGPRLEALNDIGHRQTQLLIVLNDNEMSISPSVGARQQVPLRDQALAGLAPGPRRPTTP